MKTLKLLAMWAICALGQITALSSFNRAFFCVAGVVCFALALREIMRD